MNYLHVMHNHKHVDSTNFTIFPKEFDGVLYASTYSISPAFINENLTHIDSISLIIGLSNQEYQNNNAISILNFLKEYTQNKDDIAFVNQLNLPNKERICNKTLEILIPYVNMHSKIYLLKNRDGTRCRVITGSANLTEQGFNPNIPQHENVEVIDDDFEYFAHYEKHFHNLKSQTVNFISPKTFEHLTSNIHKPTILNSNEKIEHSTMLLTTMLDAINQATDSGELPENYINNYSNTLSLEEENAKTNLQFIKLKKHLICQPKDKKKSKRFNVQKKTIQKVIENILPLHEIEKNEDLKRQELVRDDSQGHIYVVDNNIPLQFEKKLSVDEIRKNLELIDQIIMGYQKYSTRYNEDIGTKILEAIFYAFTAPYLSYIRSLADPTLKTEIPIFLFLGGNAGSGKSSILRIISKMTQFNPSLRPFIDYSLISQHSSESEKTKKSRAFVDGVLKETNVSPIFMDEIPANFFTTAGENIIVNRNNNAESDRHPVFIGTTNSENYSMHGRAIRRSYYIQMNIPFKDNTRVESAKYLKNILDQLDTGLFQDFLARFILLIQNKENILFKEDQNGKLDFLYLARRIFKHYYEQTGLKIPEYFNENLLDDFKIQAKEKWMNLFVGLKENKDIFTYDSQNDILFFHHKNLNNGVAFSRELASQVYIDALPTEMCNRDTKVHVLPIKADLFFKWINYKNPYKKLFGIF